MESVKYPRFEVDSRFFVTTSSWSIGLLGFLVSLVSSYIYFAYSKSSEGSNEHHSKLVEDNRPPSSSAPLPYDVMSSQTLPEPPRPTAVETPEYIAQEPADILEEEASLVQLHSAVAKKRRTRRSKQKNNVTASANSLDQGDVVDNLVHKTVNNGDSGQDSEAVTVITPVDHVVSKSRVKKALQVEQKPEKKAKAAKQKKPQPRETSQRSEGTIMSSNHHGQQGYSHSVLKHESNEDAAPLVKPLRQPIGPSPSGIGFSAEYRKSRKRQLRSVSI